MAKNNNILNFTAADIEKYHKGVLLPAEMHAMEKAALDDPFLADAMEGYAMPGVDAVSDIADLKRRLEERSSDTKVIPIGTASKNKIPWLKIAAVVLLIASAGLLFNQYVLTKKDKDIALNNVPKIEEVRPTENNNQSINNNEADLVTSNNQFDSSKLNNLSKPPAGKTADAKEINNPSTVTSEATPPAIVAENDKSVVEKKAKAAEGSLERKQNSLDEVTVVASADKQSKKETGNESSRMQPIKKAPTALSKDRAESEVAGNFSNVNKDDAVDKIFKGRVTDAHNNGVPFANVTNSAENTGTYTDANGYFNLTYPDSVLTVQIKSIGFESNIAKLKTNLTANKIVLTEDRNSLNEIVISNKLPNAARRSRDANRSFEEPEPEDGWTNYDAYLANNLNPPDNIKIKPSSYPSVEVSFEVDSKGEPTNIRIEKSLCTKCDQEAIRLVKEGPKWKKKANKNGRTTVTVNF